MKAVFLDRDGVITKDPGFARYEDLQLMPNAAEAIRRLNKNYLVIILTNQPVIARGIMLEEEVYAANNRLVSQLGADGARIDAVYFCPHHPEKHHDTPEHAKKYRIECSCRKPGTGMIEQAHKDFKIDIKHSFVIGDRTADIKMGEDAGCKTILVRTDYTDSKYSIEPDYEAQSVLEASKIISPGVKAVILAGGRGERLKPLTDTIPKPMIKIAGKPVLQHQIEILGDAGIKEVVVCGSYLVDKIKEYFGSEWKGVSISYPHEPEQLGSGGAIKNARQFLKGAERLVIINGDKMIGNFDFRKMIEFDLQKKAFATLLVRETDHPLDSDIIELDGERVVGFIGRGQDMLKTSNSGIIIASSEILDKIPSGKSNIEKDVLFPMISKKEIFGFMMPSSWFVKDVGTPERLAAVRKRFEGS